MAIVTSTISRDLETTIDFLRNRANLRLLTNSTLGIGVSEVEKSCVDDYYADLGFKHAG